MAPVQDVQRHAIPAGGALDGALERNPATARTPAGEPSDLATLNAGARPDAPRLPHEHDENADSPHAPRKPIQQAETDLIEGRQDTDLRSKAGEVFDNATSRRGRG